ncbi:hypothetical protein G9A89_005236 [Geosiphon pyriformis]|nr:hypothetical protein G9A89_005236 [Geosiphon pyriformis]
MTSMVLFSVGQSSSSGSNWTLMALFLFGLSFLFSYEFGVVGVNLLYVNTACLSVYMDESLSGLGTSDMVAGAAVFFEDIDLGLGVRVFGLVFSMMAELQAIALALKCISFSYSADLFSDSQIALDAYKSEFVLACLDFKNQC